MRTQELIAANYKKGVGILRQLLRALLFSNSLILVSVIHRRQMALFMIIDESLAKQKRNSYVLNFVVGDLG
jgi:hypothetical protein